MINKPPDSKGLNIRILFVILLRGGGSLIRGLHYKKQCKPRIFMNNAKIGAGKTAILLTGFRFLGFGGFRVLGFRFWVSGCRFWVLGFRVYGTGVPSGFYKV